MKVFLPVYFLPKALLIVLFGLQIIYLEIVCINYGPAPVTSGYLNYGGMH
jgi:hypothetical protein